MALVRLRFQVDGDVQVSRAFEAYEHEVADMSTPLGRIGLKILEAVREQYATEGAHSGDPWRRLSAGYAAWKGEHFPGQPILVQTGESRAEALSPHALTVTRDKVVYEPDSDLLGWHYRGA